MTASTPNRRRDILRGIRVLAWDDAGALQGLAAGELLRPDWFAIVPSHVARPRWIPRSADQYSLEASGEVVFAWRDDA